MKIQNINNLFDSLVQDEKSDIQMLSLTKGEVSLIMAELKPEKKLPAHYHNKGTEIYQILSGEGQIEIGELSPTGVTWLHSLIIKAGDVFEVTPKMVHRLSNHSTLALRMVFLTPPSHLGDDRIFIDQEVL